MAERLAAGSDEVLGRSATHAAQMIARKQISSRELTELLLARIDAVNPVVNAVVELRHEAALREAAAADEAFGRGESVGRLHGVRADDDQGCLQVVRGSSASYRWESLL